MPQTSYSFNFEEWADNEDGIEWQCDKCGIRIVRKKDAIAHVKLEHRFGTIWPRMTDATKNAASMRIQISGHASKELAQALVKRDERHILKRMGFILDWVGDEKMLDEMVSKHNKDNTKIPKEKRPSWFPVDTKRFKKIYFEWEKMKKEYVQLFNDGSSEIPLPTIDDFKVRLTDVLGPEFGKLGEKRLKQAIKSGNEGWLDL